MESHEQERESERANALFMKQQQNHVMLGIYVYKQTHNPLDVL